MLELQNLNVFYGGIHALKDVSLKVNEGEIVTLIGSNGAGKTTTLRTISGLETAKSGKVVFKGQDITKSSAPEIVRLGLSHVPEGRRVFADMSVYENLEMGAYTRKDKSKVEKEIQDIYSLFPILHERRNQKSSNLSGGEQQMLAMGRALLSRPDLLLLDEPSMGLAPLIVKEIFDIVENINKDGTTVLLVEQNAKMALNSAHRAYIIKNGGIELQGKASDLLNNDEVKKAYLGG